MRSFVDSALHPRSLPATRLPECEAHSISGALVPTLNKQQVDRYARARRMCLGDVFGSGPLRAGFPRASTYAGRCASEFRTTGRDAVHRHESRDVFHRRSDYLSGRHVRSEVSLVTATVCPLPSIILSFMQYTLIMLYITSIPSKVT